MTANEQDPAIVAPHPASRSFPATLVVVLTLYTTAQMAFPGGLGAQASFVDFHVFRLVGELLWSNALPTAYHAAEFAPLQAAQPGNTEFLPYSYPPQANVLPALLALVPDWAGFLAFMGLSLAALRAVLRRLAPEQAPGAFLLVLPAVLVCIRGGQNGILTAALIGAVCLLWQRRAAAGVPLGLLSFKPHLAVGLGVAVLLRMRLAVAAMATIVVLLWAGVATLAFGAGIWRDFLEGARETAGFLDRGLFPFYRMTSVYALLRSFGVGSGPAMALHVAVAAAALAVLARACLGGWEARRMLAVSVMAGLLVSPYLYDYDTAAAAVALALAGPDIARAGRGLRAGLFAALVLATGWGLLNVTANPSAGQGTPSLGGLGMVVAFALVVVVLRAAESPRRAAQLAAT